MVTKLAGAAVLLPLLLWSQGVQAQQFPSKPVTLVVATTAGGQTDVLMRRIAEELKKEWGQSVLIENKPGASTIIGATYVARAPADGYTILVANDPTLSSNQYLHSKLSYDPVNDFAPVLNMVETVSILIAESSFAPKNLSELIALAKQKPGEIAYASFGQGSKTHLDTEALAQKTGTKFTHIPYRGIANVIIALLAKQQIDFALSGIAPALPHIRDGKLKALGIAGPERSSVLPDVPTFAEAGIPNYESRAWFGLVVPAGTPRAVIDKIARDTSKVITRPDFLHAHILSQGFGLLNQGPDVYAEFLKKDRAEYAIRVKNINLKLN